MCSIICLPLGALTRVGVTLSLLCCQRVAICFRLAIGVQLLYSTLHTKFFTKLVYKRLRPTLERHQSKDQAGLRPCTSVEDVFVVLESVCSKSLEWNFPVWFASLNVKKASNRIEYIYFFFLAPFLHSAAVGSNPSRSLLGAEGEPARLL